MAPLLLVLSIAGIGQAQNHEGAFNSAFYLELSACTACGAYGNRIVQLLKQNGVLAFNGYAECSGSHGSCFSATEYGAAKRIIRSPTQGSEVGVMVGPFPTVDDAVGVMRRLRFILKPVFNEWNQGWPNSSLIHDNGNAYNIQPLSIWLLKFGNAGLSSGPTPTTSANIPAVAGGDWTTFWNSFRTAVQSRDRRALMNMMPTDFTFDCCDNADTNGNGDTRDEALKLWDNPKVHGWTRLLRINIQPSPHQTPYYWVYLTSYDGGETWQVDDIQDAGCW